MKLESLGSYRRDSIMSRILVMVCVLGSLATSVFLYIDSRQFILKQSDRKVVIDKDNHAWLATERTITMADRKIQYEEHVKDFYRMFFAFDAGTFDTNVNRALNLMDGEVGKGLYIKEYVEKSLAREVTENNWNLTIEINKVEVDVSRRPIQGTVFAKQTLKRPAGEVMRNMNAKFTVDDARVSYDNPRGVIITSFDIFDNSRIAPEN